MAENLATQQASILAAVRKNLTSGPQADLAFGPDVSSEIVNDNFADEDLPINPADEERDMLSGSGELSKSQSVLGLLRGLVLRSSSDDEGGGGEGRREGGRLSLSDDASIKKDNNHNNNNKGDKGVPSPRRLPTKGGVSASVTDGGVGESSLFDKLRGFINNNTNNSKGEEQEKKEVAPDTPVSLPSPHAETTTSQESGGGVIGLIKGYFNEDDDKEKKKGNKKKDEEGYETEEKTEQKEEVVEREVPKPATTTTTPAIKKPTEDKGVLLSLKQRWQSFTGGGGK